MDRTADGGYRPRVDLPEPSSLLRSSIPGGDHADKRFKGQTSELVRVETPPDDGGSFTIAEVGIHLREVLGDEMVSDPDLVALFCFLKLSFKGQEASQFQHVYRRKLIEEALPLGDEIGNIGRILGVVLIPSSVQELTILLHRRAGNEHQQVPLRDEIFAEGLMVIGGGLTTEHHLLKAVLYLQCCCMDEQFFKSLPGVVEDQSSQQGLSRRGAEEGMMALFGDIDTYHQMLRRSANLMLELTELLEPAIIILYHRDLLVTVIVMWAHQQIA